ncbi:MAG: ArnT family glycosyltransferase [Alphaproteobacteria bacterium]
MAAVGLGDDAAQRADAGSLWRWALAGVAGLTLLRWVVLALSPLELYGDEAQYWTWAQDLDFGYFTKPPLIAWIIAGTTALFGDDAFGVRVGAPLCHAVAALFIGLAGRELAGPRVGALAMLAYATLPGVSYSSLILSTDAPLLACWAVALWAFLRLLATRRLGWALATGLAIAVGLNAKYAMGFFLLCAGLHALFTPDARWLLRRPHGAVLLLVGLAGLAPNLAWNLANDWATVGHTAENANWGGPLLRPDRGLEFFAAQFGVFGPVLFAVLLALAWGWARGRVSPQIRLALVFALPILALITAQAFLSRAHANWAATAYVAGSLAVMLALSAPRFRAWLAASFALHGVTLAGLYLAVVLADVAPWPEGRDPFARLRGWAAAASALEEAAGGADGRLVIADDRMVLASLIHAARDTGLRFAAWDADGAPGNHYELTIPYDTATTPPALLVSVYPETVDALPAAWPVGERQDLSLPVGAGMTRTLYLWRVN